MVSTIAESRVGRCNEIVRLVCGWLKPVDGQKEPSSRIRVNTRGSASELNAYASFGKGVPFI